MTMYVLEPEDSFPEILTASHWHAMKVHTSLGAVAVVLCFRRLTMLHIVVHTLSVCGLVAVSAHTRSLHSADVALQWSASLIHTPALASSSFGHNRARHRSLSA